MPARQQTKRDAATRPGAPASTLTKLRPGPFALEHGGELRDVQVAYRTWGTLNAARDNAVVVCHPLTQSADVDAWWGDMLGAGRALDPERDYVICSNVLGSCYGTTGPASSDARSRTASGPAFPVITVRDMVGLQLWLVRELGARRVRMVVGAGLGAMQALEWALMAPEMVRSLVAIGATGRQSAWCIGLSEAQRCAIYDDPRFKDGRYDPADPPKAGLAIARMIAVCSYRSRASLEKRFGRKVEDGRCFAVESFLHEQGLKLAARFDANSYMTLTRAMDSHDLARGRGDYESVLRAIAAPTLIVSMPADVLYPTEEQVELVRTIPHARLVHLRSSIGHDAFLLEAQQLSGLVAAFRRRVEQRDPG